MFSALIFPPVEFPLEEFKVKQKERSTIDIYHSRTQNEKLIHKSTTKIALFLQVLPFTHAASIIPRSREPRPSNTDARTKGRIFVPSGSERRVEPPVFLYPSKRHAYAVCQGKGITYRYLPRRKYTLAPSLEY